MVFVLWLYLFSFKKSFRETNKNNSKPRGKALKAIQGHRNQLFKSNAFAQKNILPLDKQKEIFYKLAVERIETIEKLYNTIDFNNLTHPSLQGSNNKCRFQ